MTKDEILKIIQDMESELAELKAELNKPEKFEFKYSKIDNYMINYYGVHRNLHVMNKDYLQNFRYRQTEANAKADFQLQKELMCISALAEQIDPNYKSKIIWDGRANNYHIVYNYMTKEYTTSYRSALSRLLGVVYMPKDVAKKVCEILNNKEVELK